MFGNFVRVRCRKSNIFSGTARSGAVCCRVVGTDGRVSESIVRKNGYEVTVAEGPQSLADTLEQVLDFRNVYCADAGVVVALPDEV